MLGPVLLCARCYPFCSHFKAFTMPEILDQNTALDDSKLNIQIAIG